MKNSSIIIFIKRLKSALFSKKRAAYLGLFILFISPITQFIDRLFTTSNQSSAEVKNLPNILLIACSSRNGGTIVYQALTRIIPSIYISNLTQVFPNLAYPYISKNNRFGKSSLTKKLLWIYSIDI